MKKLSIVIGLIFISCLQSFSCGCSMYPVSYYADKVPYIFTGEVVEVLDTTDWAKESLMPYEKAKVFYKNKGYLVKVKVLSPFKNTVSKFDILEFTSEFSNCDPLYENGKAYLFFADKEGKKFKMRHCTYWGELNETAKYIEPLKQALSNKKSKNNR